ncbi:MAG: helix-turn-helix domain-containing GNAT family N-acetyltransferase [Gemmatimonadaceae bacterium]
MTTARSKAVPRPPRVSTKDIEAVRRFNRFYTTQIGALDQGHLDSPFGLTEVRVLYELAHRDGLSATDLATELKLDAGYVSRLLQRLRLLKIVGMKPAPDDARRRILSLTALGRRTFAPLLARANAVTEQMLSELTDEARAQVVHAMGSLERLLKRESDPAPAFVIRTHAPGDIGWVIERHGTLYPREYGWNGQFEALVAKIAGAFLENFDASYERCWIAERNGERVGSVFVVKKDATTAQLRLLIVDPSARGLGIGERLVAECEKFARQVGYTTIKLWTQSNLTSARKIYERLGYRLVGSNAHESFGAKLVAEDWERRLE